MKPKILKISGLNSFEEEQTIYFDKLTEKGLFGIFGPTGSGKSTILDAITIALYGKITRTNKGYINTTTKNLIVSYEFEIGIGSERKTYRAERNIKINKNGGYNTKYARLIERGEKGEIVLAEGPSELQSEIEKIIGLTADDFTRSVVLPQGKFSEFLKLTGKDKRDMLERIFALEKFGKELGDRIKKVRNKNLKEENILCGELKKYEGLTEDSFKEKESQLDSLLKEEKIITEEKNKLDSDYEKYKDIWQLQKELNEYKNKEYKLKNRLEEINIKQERLENAQKALKVKPFIDEIEDTKRAIGTNEKELEHIVTKLKEVEYTLEKTDRDYNEILEKKEELIPSLIKKEANIIQAIEIDKKVSMLQQERKKLRLDYARINSEKVILEKKIKDIICNKEESVKKILSIEERLNSIKVDPEYREKVQAALEIENEYKQSKVRKDDLEAKINTKRCNLDKYTKEYNEILEAQKVQNNLVIELEKEMEELLKDNPGDNSKLLEKAEKVNSYREKFKSALKDDEKRKDLINKLDAVEKDIKPVELKLEEAKESLLENKESLEKVSEEIDHINKKNLASILGAELEEGKPCPVCGSLHHISPVKALDKKDLESREKEKKKLEKLIEEINTYISKVSLTIVSFQKEREHILKELESIQIKLKDIIIEELKDNKENIENEFVLMKDKVQKYVEKKDEITKELTIQKDKKSKIDMKEAKIGEIMRSEKNLLNDLNEEFIKENNKFNKIKDEYLLLKKQLQLDDIPLRMKEIKDYEVESVSLQKVEKDLRDIIEKEDKSKEILSIQERELEIELGKIVQSGKEKAKIIEREEEELKKLSEGQNLQEYLEVIRKEIININEKAERLKNNLEKERNNRQQIYDKKLSLEEAKKILQKRFEEQNNKCISSLKENDFTDIEDVLKVILDEKSISEIQQEINIFNDEFKNIMNNISRIEEKLNGEFIEEEKWEQLKKDRLEKQEILKFKIQEIAALQKTIDDLKQDMKELKELRKKEQELQHKLSLLNDLGKLVEGNKFVEFAAMNQLKYIAREASRRLKDITKERYALEIDSDGNFIIRDDFNGGDIRETTTLSGGETFLTSLSLALALSSQVQLKGSAPLEFFFLDEGFGTLDTELLDTVMNSLERLHSSKLSVGIISHVEELKNRVPVKLVVNPSKQGEGGSKVKLEYS